ncbi:MAG: bifunctional phosphoribosyl-AMP cyclohydrolase/phosphoribosyl-ATP diphosphatase HisIE [Clostridia bacterium]|nr:bifunctional phosphoribosyl-AMP cyclohydrolase/phosphoribosyl-ATP diphosphatase HisIE [Clostridia bacterium]
MMDLSQVKFNEQGLIPAIAQDAATGEVLMLAWMNAESLSLTLETGYATYFSRSRQKLWKKGETSGHTQKVLGLKLDCDRDAILLTVEQTGPACHTGARSCFFNDVLTPDEDELPASAAILERVYSVIEDRREHPQEGSYTNYLLEKGIEKICKKVGEEASETIIAAMKNSPEEVTYEAADLLYHLLVLCFERGVRPADLWAELARRR